MRPRKVSCAHMITICDCEFSPYYGTNLFLLDTEIDIYFLNKCPFIFLGLLCTNIKINNNYNLWCKKKHFLDFRGFMKIWFQQSD